MKLPDEAETIAEGPPGPLLARYARDGRQYLLLAFAVEQSSWVLKPSFTVFFYNALRYLGNAGAVGGPAGASPGDTLMVQLPPDVETAELKRPDRTTVDAEGRTRQAWHIMAVPAERGCIVVEGRYRGA